MTHPNDALRLVPVSEADIDALRKLTQIEYYAGKDEWAGALERVIAHLTAPASPLPEGGGWRTDFENAPKDGSVFMVGYDDEIAQKARLFEPKERVYEARWNDIQSTWSSRNGFILHSDATHWMPLPAAPTGAK